MNDALCKPFTDDEISDALFQIGPLKAPDWMASQPDSFKEIGKCYERR